MSLQKGLIGHWTMDDADTSGGTLYDSSAYDNHGTIDGAPSTGVSGKIKEAYLFDGNDSGISVPSSKSLESVGNSITLSTWTTSSLSGNNNKYVSKWDGSNYEMMNSSGKLRVAVGSAGYNSPNNLQTGNTWDHLVGVFDGSEIHFYQNSDSLGSVSVSETITTTTSSLQIARDQSGGNNIDGKMDDVRIYNRALSDAEINQLYQMRSPRVQQNTLSKGLIGYWTMDDVDTSGGTLYDKSAYDNHGSLGAGVTTSANGQVGEAYNFGGTDSVSLSGDSLNQSSLSGTIILWVNTDDASIDQTAFWTEENRDRGIGLDSSTSSYVTTIFDGNISDFRELRGGSPSGWDQVGLSYDITQGTAEMYVNGSSVDSFNVSGWTDAPDGQPTDIGEYNAGAGEFLGNNAGWDGRLDDLRVYDRELSANEVSELYQKRTTSTSTADLSKQLVGHWTMDDVDTSGGTLYDNSAYGLNANINNDVSTNQSSIIGQSYLFDGTDNYLLVPESDSVGVSSGSLTRSGWFKTTMTTDGVISNQGEAGFGGSVSNRIIFGVRNGKIFAELDDASTLTTISGATSIDDNNWHHHCFVRDSQSDELRVYLDGSLDGSTADNTGDITATDGAIGIGGATFDDDYFDGYIANVRRYSRALTAKEVSELYNKRT